MTKWNCNQCDKKFESEKGLRGHVNRKHGGKAVKLKTCIENISPHPISLVMKSTKAAVQQIKCHLCSFTSSYESEARTHTASKYIDETNEYKCKTDSVEEETD